MTGITSAEWAEALRALVWAVSGGLTVCVAWRYLPMVLELVR